MRRVTRTSESELVEVAERLERGLGTPGGILVAGMLINEGLREVACAIENLGDVAGAIKDLAKANRGQ